MPTVKAMRSLALQSPNRYLFFVNIIKSKNIRKSLAAKLLIACVTARYHLCFRLWKIPFTSFFFKKCVGIYTTILRAWSSCTILRTGYCWKKLIRWTKIPRQSDIVIQSFKSGQACGQANKSPLIELICRIEYNPVKSGGLSPS